MKTASVNLNRNLQRSYRPFVFSKALNRIFTLTLLCLSSFSGTAAQSDAYIALNLTVTQTNFRSAVDTWSSRCIFGKRRWLIESHFSRNAVDCYYCDGSNVYETTQISTIPTDLPAILAQFKSPSLAGQTNLPRAGEPIVLKIVPGIHPLSETGGNLPWLAYCSGSYLRMPKQLIPLPAAVVRHDPSSFAFEHQEEVFSDDLALPKRLSLVCSQNLLKNSPFDTRMLRTDGQVEMAKTRGDWGVRVIDGMLAARYTVISSTNVVGWTIPTIFTYEQFELGKDPLVPWLVASGTATDIHVVEEPQSIVSAMQHYTAVDYRLRSREKILDNIIYPITNGVVPAVSDPRLRALFARAEMNAAVDPTMKTSYGIYWLFLAFLAGPVIVIINWWRKST